MSTSAVRSSDTSSNVNDKPPVRSAGGSEGRSRPSVEATTESAAPVKLSTEAQAALRTRNEEGADAARAANAARDNESYSKHLAERQAAEQAVANKVHVVA